MWKFPQVGLVFYKARSTPMEINFFDVFFPPVLQTVRNIANPDQQTKEMDNWIDSIRSAPYIHVVLM